MLELFVNGVDNSSKIEFELKVLDQKTVSGILKISPVPQNSFEVEAVLDEQVIGRSTAHMLGIVEIPFSDQQAIFTFDIALQFSVGGNYDFGTALHARKTEIAETARDLDFSSEGQDGEESVLQPAGSSGARIEGHVDRLTRWEAQGWAWAPELPDLTVQIEALLDGRIIGRSMASDMREDLAKAGKGTGLYGFAIKFGEPLPNDVFPQIRASADGASASTLSTTETAVLRAEGTSAIPGQDIQNVARVEGAVDRLTRWEAHGWAWMPDLPDTAVQVEAVLDGRIIGRSIAADEREDLANAGKGTGLYGFVIKFEKPIVIDRVPQIRVLTPHAQPLPGGRTLPALSDAEINFTIRGTIDQLLEEHGRFTSRGPDYEDFDRTILLRSSLHKQDQSPLVMAFYLPQFHAIPENDLFWGAGFTEWRQLPRAHTRFPGHYQPRIPSDLGFYTLDNGGILERQSRLAKEAGVNAFAFYYYWFNRKRVLESPLETLLRSDIEMPFLLIWANENWTRTWDGSDSQVLLKQDYREEDEDPLIQDLARHFADPRYVRLEGRPLFVIYNPRNVPDAAESFRRWRRKLEHLVGISPLMFMAQTFGDNDPRPYGLDGALEFPPHKLSNHLPGRPTPDAYSKTFTGRVIRYDDFVATSLNENPPDYPLIKTIVPSWDNESRRPNRGLSLEALSPKKYEKWFHALVYRAREQPLYGRSVVAINAWNEWAESAYLEPDVYFGSSFLNATARALASVYPSAPAAKLPAEERTQAKRNVTAILPNYNHEDFIEQRVRSVIEQSLQPAEIIFLDDCSTDGSVRIARDLLESSNIPHRFVRNERNSGNVFRQWLKGLELATHNLIWVAETDDFADKDFLKFATESFAAEDIMASFGKVQCVDEQGTPSSDLEKYFDDARLCSWHYPFALPSFQAFNHDFTVQNIVPNASALVFRKPQLTQQEIERLYEYRFAGDWYLYAKILRGGRISYDPRAKSFFRVRKNSTSRSAFHTNRHVDEHVMIIEDISREYGPSAEAVQAHILSLARYVRSIEGNVLQEAIQSAAVTMAEIPMRICIAAHSFAIGGGEVLPLELANELKRRGCHVTYMVLERDEQDSSFTLRGRLRSDIPVVYWDEVRDNFAQFIIDFGIQIFNSHNVSLEYHIYLAHASPPCIYAASLHGGYETVPHLLTPDFVKFLNDNVNCWVSLAEKNQEILLRAGVSSHNFKRSFNALPSPGEWIDRAEFRSQHSIPADAFVVVQSSRAIKEKNWQVTIDAAGEVRRRTGKEIFVVLFGDGPDAEDLRHANSALPYVKFFGFMDRPARYFRCFDLGVFPSTFSGETFPLFLLECFQAGLPVIAADVGEIRNMVLGGAAGPAGVIVSSSAGHQVLGERVAAAISQVIDDDDALAKLSRGAISRSDDFSIAKLSSFYVKEFENLLNRPNS